MNEQERLKENVARVAAVLKANGIDQAVASYSGCGDDGNIEGVEVSWQGGVPLDPEPTVTLIEMERLWNGGGYIETRREFACELTEAMHALTDDAISNFGHSGYQDNDGGRGEFVVMAEGSARLDHTDYYTESETTNYELDAPAIQTTPAIENAVRAGERA